MTAGRNEVRIIAGRWRGRRLRFPAEAGIRPTPDRVRETLFNWLQADIGGARCLDLFAGSGALGLEALSRGADSVVLVDRDARVVAYLRDTLKALDAAGGEVRQGEADAFLRSAGRRFDLVFLDPPFAHHALATLLATLAGSGQLAPGALVYIEHAVRDGAPPLPPGFAVWRSKRAGEVGYHLLAWEGSQP
ncbi:MAG: 16S rRNA (guanine(966)-N(2))-methyltransferase RsmD [Pseudomonadota bacterium]